MKLFFRRLFFTLRKPPPEHWRRQLVKLPWLLLLPLALLLKELAAGNSTFVENVYSMGIYPVVSQAVGFLFGWIPFSAAEILAYSGILGIIVYFFYQAAQVILKGDKVLRAFRTVVNLALIGSVGYFLFIALWGLNYYRQPLAVTLGYTVTPRSVDDLTELCQSLAATTGNLRMRVPEDDNGVMKLTGGKRAVLKKISGAYASLSDTFPLFGAKYGPPKPVLMSKSMSYTNIQGIYIPLTVEPNVNMDMPDAFFPSTACHEAAHEYGFAREDEANFIGYLACMASGDVEMQYSGALMALTISMNALAGYDRDAYWEIADTYYPGIVRDLDDQSLYWRQFEGPVAETSTKVNNAYLISNKQTDGVNSYGRMVDLLLAAMAKSKVD